MHYNEIIEGIRMGSKELSAGTKRNYTIGFEFEVAGEGIPSEYNTSYDMSEDDIDLDRAREDHSNQFDELDFDDWFNDDGQTSYFDTMQDEDLEPVYGRPDREEVIDWLKGHVLRQMNERLRTEKFPYQRRFKSFDKMAEVVKEYEKNPKMDFEQVVNFFMLDLNEFRNKKASREEVIEALGKRSNSLAGEEHTHDYSELVSSTIDQYKQALKIVNKPEWTLDDITEDDVSAFETLDEFCFDSAGNIVEVNEIDEAKIFNELFDFDVEEYFEDDYQDALQDAIAADFNDWLDRHYDEYVSGSGGAISYCKELLGEMGYDDWNVVEDGTSGVDAEMVTDVMTLDDGIGVMKHILQAISDDPHIKTTQDTGLHINIGTFKDYNSIDWLKFLVVIRADKILSDFGRNNNNFTPDKLPKIIHGMEEHRPDLYKDAIESINKVIIGQSDKYSAVNLSKLSNYGYIEVRAAGNAGYDKKADIVERHIRRIVRAIDIASDPSSYRKEYLKKLRSFDIKTNEKNTMSPLAKWLNQFVAWNENDLLESLSGHLIEQLQRQKTVANKTYNMKIHKQLKSLFDNTNDGKKKFIRDKILETLNKLNDEELYDLYIVKSIMSLT